MATRTTGSISLLGAVRLACCSVPMASIVQEDGFRELLGFAIWAHLGSFGMIFAGCCIARVLPAELEIVALLPRGGGQRWPLLAA